MSRADGHFLPSFESCQEGSTLPGKGPTWFLACPWAAPALASLVQLPAGNLRAALIMSVTVLRRVFLRGTPIPRASECSMVLVSYAHAKWTELGCLGDGTFQVIPSYPRGGGPLCLLQPFCRSGRCSW